MSHAYASARTANLLGALAVGVTDRIRHETEQLFAQGPSAPAALLALSGPGAGRSIEALRSTVGLTHSGAVRLVDRLVAGGLVERRAGADQRSTALYLTPAGRRAVRRILAHREAVLEGVLAVLTTEERELLARTCERLLGQVTTGAEYQVWVCRLCDREACGRGRGWCPVERIERRG
jgi:DNA-binding MarR family transcriptional regulator